MGPYLSAFFLLIAFLTLSTYLAGKRFGWQAGLFVFLFIISTAFLIGGLQLAYRVEYTDVIYKSTGSTNNGYTPLAHTHSLTFFVFYLFGIIAQFILWLKGRTLPPLLFVILVSLLMIGITINFVFLLQASWNKEDGEIVCCFILLPSLLLITGVMVLIKILKPASDSVQMEYQNPILNYLNKAAVKIAAKPIWIFLLTLPVFILITFVLILFGQQPDAMVKVFTDTSTWLLSQKAHPPYVNYNGHYLCTVAACGNPEIVKPLCIGKRHGNPIIVNRQLQVANAFEELIQHAAPSFHRIIRKAYDDYGYPLSEKITTPRRSNITYILMKPLEYFFLAVLYLFCLEPEKMIERQYMAHN